jgi:hypothetical protein
MRSQQQNLMLHVLLIALLGLMIMGNTNHTFFAMSASKPTKNLLKIVAVVAAAVMLNRVEYVRNKRDEATTFVKGEVSEKAREVVDHVKAKVSDKGREVVEKNLPIVKQWAFEEGKKLLSDNMGVNAVYNIHNNSWSRPVKTIKGIWDLNQNYKMAMGIGAMGVGAARRGAESARDAYKGARDAKKKYDTWATDTYSPEERVNWISTTLGTTMPEFVEDVPENIVGQNNIAMGWNTGLENGATGTGILGRLGLY